MCPDFFFFFFFYLSVWLFSAAFVEKTVFTPLLCFCSSVKYQWAVFVTAAVVQSPDRVWLFVTLWTAAQQTCLCLTISWLFPSSCPLDWWYHPANSSSNAIVSFYPQSFAESGTFPMSQLFTSDDQNTGASTSASVLPINIQGWFPLSLTGLISLLSKGLSGIFSSTTIWR